MRPVTLIMVLAMAYGGHAALAAPALTGKWRIVAVAGADALDVEKTRAEFAANGRFASTVGCNRIAGKPTHSASGLSFGPMMTTRMACPPPLDQTEGAYLAALEAVRGYRLEGASLFLVGDDGEARVTLRREK